MRMKGRLTRLLAMTLITALVGTIVACGDSSRGPTTPTSPEQPTAPTTTAVPPKPSGPTYTISGVITDYHGGPLGGATVVVYSCNLLWGIPCAIQTDQQGHYSLATPSLEPTALGVWKPGYQNA